MLTSSSAVDRRKNEEKENAVLLQEVETNKHPWWERILYFAAWVPISLAILFVWFMFVGMVMGESKDVTSFLVLFIPGLIFWGIIALIVDVLIIAGVAP